MLILLSPAKDLAKETPMVPGTTQPVLLEHSIPIVAKLKTFPAKKVAKLMDLSAALGELNRERYERWSMPFTPTNARPAVFTFNGEVYRGLAARTLSPEDLQFAQHHLRILSGLYGVLRPLDLMQDYRLMMGTGLSVGRAKNLIAYWGDRITEVLKQDLEANQTNTVINLASSEYFKAVKPAKLGARVITPVFKDRGPAGYKIVMVFAKNQRGAMARHIIQHRILEPEKLKAYDGNGYRYAPEQSTADEWVYLREKKP